MTIQELKEAIKECEYMLSDPNECPDIKMEVREELATLEADLHYLQLENL